MADVRALVAADGGDLVLEGVDGDTVTLTLVLDSAECRECVMPGAFLEQVALDMMAAAVPDLRAVVIHDPRASDLPGIGDPVDGAAAIRPMRRDPKA